MPHALKLLRLHPEAAAELQDSINFYRERGGEQLAQRFKLHIEAGFRAIIENPEMYAPVRDLPEAQKFRLQHFPFSILYVNRPQLIWIVAVAHGRRRPGYY